MQSYYKSSFDAHLQHLMMMMMQLGVKHHLESVLQFCFVCFFCFFFILLPWHLSRNIPHFHKCKVSDSRVRVDIQIKTRKGRALCSANSTHSFELFVYTHVVTLIGENWRACQPIKCFSLCLIPFIHTHVSACLCLTRLQTKRGL